MQILHGVMRSFCDAPDWADLAEAYCTIFTGEPSFGSGPPPYTLFISLIWDSACDCRGELRANSAKPPRG